MAPADAEVGGHDGHAAPHLVDDGAHGLGAGVGRACLRRPLGEAGVGVAEADALLMTAEPPTARPERSKFAGSPREIWVPRSCKRGGPTTR